MPAQTGYFDTLKSVAGKVFTYLASITLTGIDGKTITCSQNTDLDEAVAMSSKAPKDNPTFTTKITTPQVVVGSVITAFSVNAPTQISIAANAEASLPAGAYGMMFISDQSIIGNSALLCFTGSTAITAIIWQDGTVFSTTKDTASKINIYLTTGALTIQNKTAGNPILLGVWTLHVGVG